MANGENEGPWGPRSKKPADDSSGDFNPWMRKERQRKNSGRPDINPPPVPPELDELWRKFMAWAKSRLPRKRSRLMYTLAGMALSLWLLSGFYLVAADQMGVVLRFGALARTEMPGLRYHLPYPIERVLLPVVTAQNEIPIGFRKRRGSDEEQSVPEESMMLTQDENVINVQFAVFWRVSDVARYLFEIRDPQQTIKMAAESVMREVIGQNKLQFALTEGRSQIAEEARTRLQSLLDEYNAGVIISQINLQTVSVPDEVKAAFQDVINARLDQERFQNQAAAHVNKVIPEAKGKAAQILQQAMAYREQKISLAKGEADRFREILAAVNSGRDVTTRRLYLETMESVLGKTQKVIMDKSSGAALLPYFPLQQAPKIYPSPSPAISPDKEGVQQ